VTGQQFDSFGGFRVFKKKVGQVSGARNWNQSCRYLWKFPLSYIYFI
jgi:hypothetical protein